MQPLNFLSSECEYVSGCTDSLALNYSEEANFDNGSCEYPVMGCTDSSALNFDEEAMQDNGSCEYPIDCSGLTAIIINMNDSYGDGWNGNVLTFNGQSFTLESGSEGAESTCYDPELGCVEVVVSEGGWLMKFLGLLPPKVVMYYCLVVHRMSGNLA